MAPPGPGSEPKDGDTGLQVSWLGARRSDDRSTPTLVALHGYGSNEQLLLAAVPVLGMFLPGINARVIALRGDFPVPGRPRGFSWFPGSVYEQPSADAIAGVADGVAAQVSRYTDRAVWLGFSQGMCTGIAVMRRHPRLFRVWWR